VHGIPEGWPKETKEAKKGTDITLFGFFHFFRLIKDAAGWCGARAFPLQRSFALSPVSGPFLASFGRGKNAPITYGR